MTRSPLLVRTFGLLEAPSTGRTVHGIAVPFGPVAEVSDGFGRYKERFAYGAFTRTIAERGDRVKLALNHDLHGRLPIGKVTALQETREGLRVEARVSQTQQGDEALELVRDGALDSFSVSFRPVRERTVNGVVERTEVRLGSEISLVANPAYVGALVQGVRTAPPVLAIDVARRRLALLEGHIR